MVQKVNKSTYMAITKYYDIDIIAGLVVNNDPFTHILDVK